ncbi:MAG: (2Fe-2S) ferredoxin domain-containing protein [Gammaproteobacteria bacterium]|nr:(2Fe-2S) ferredoxin domain-containing protein [Gammaproteobacteria bacterium]
MPRPEKHVFVCTQSRPPGHPRGSCTEKGAGDVMAEFGQQFEQKGLWGKYLLTSTGCIGGCDSGPVVLVYPEGVMYGNVTKGDVAAIIDEHLLGNTPVERLKVAADIW